MSEGLRELLEEENPDALLAEGFEDAMVGLARRCSQPTLAVYDHALGVQVLIRDRSMSYQEAVEWMEFNVVGAWMGEHTPVWLMHAEHTPEQMSAVIHAPTSQPDPPKTGGG